MILCMRGWPWRWGEGLDGVLTDAKCKAFIKEVPAGEAGNGKQAGQQGSRIRVMKLNRGTVSRGIQLKWLRGLETVAGASLGRESTESRERHTTSKEDLGASGGAPTALPEGEESRNQGKHPSHL